MKVKFTNLYKLAPEKTKLIKKINFLIKNSIFIGGEEVKRFEKNFLEIIDKIKKNRIIIFIAHSKTIKNFCDINFLINDKMIELTKKKIND